MAYTSVSVTATQALGTPSIVTFTNASVGTPGTITAIRIFLRTSTDLYLTDDQGSSSTPSYTTWPIADATFMMDVLTEATALEGTFQFVDSGGTVINTYTTTFCFDIQDYIFALGILASQTSSPGVLQDTNYYNSFMQFIVNLFNAETAITDADDTYSSQQALNRNQLMMNNESFYF